MAMTVFVCLKILPVLNQCMKSFCLTLTSLEGTMGRECQGRPWREGKQRVPDEREPGKGMQSREWGALGEGELAREGKSQWQEEPRSAGRGKHQQKG